MPSRPRIPSATSASLDSAFTFRNQNQFDASKSLLRSRSDFFFESTKKQEKDRNVLQHELSTPWDIQPPDFRLQLYQPKPKKRNEKESMIPNFDEDQWRREHSEKRREKITFERIPLPKILQKDESLDKPFATRFRIPDSYTAKLMSVKDGQFHPGPYRNPGPPVFRPDEFRTLVKKYGVPDFDTSYPHDPQGLKAKSKGLQVLCESYKDLDAQKYDGYRKQLVTFRPHDPKWELQLTLPTGAYKKGCLAHSALMRRVAKQLPWCSDRDKLEPIMRPDIYDYKTVDWVSVTAYSMEPGTQI